MKKAIIIDDGFEKPSVEIVDKEKKDKETSFSTIYSRYMRSTSAKKMTETHDIVAAKDGRYLRANYAGHHQDKTPITSVPKRVNGFKLSTTELEDPLLRFEKPNEVQIKMIEQVERLSAKGSFCLNAACGSGKTIAGLSIIKRLGCKTLIISARNAVNDQWKCEIKKYFPQLRISDDRLPKKGDNIDIYIFTPQYLTNHISVEDLQYLKVDLIIYDELHSLLSNKFSKTLALGMFMKLNKLIDYLPYMVGLTATIPQQDTKHYLKIVRIFGLPMKTNDTIRSIPVKYLDVRNIFQNSLRGIFDQNYNALNDFNAIDVLLEYVYRNKNKQFISNFGSLGNSSLKYKSTKDIKHITDFDFSNRITIDNKFLIITGSIASSVYGALKACEKFKTNVLLIRSASEIDIYIKYEDLKNSKYQYDQSITLDEFKKDIKDGLVVAEFCQYQSKLSETTIICGTYHRLLEGFNCPNITDGICTKFIWSPLARVQLLGRIRRSRSSDKENPLVRQFIVNSGVIPSNLKMPRRIGRPRITYDKTFENTLFGLENYQQSKNIFDAIAIRKIINVISNKTIDLVKIPKGYSDEFYSQNFEIVHDYIFSNEEPPESFIKKINEYKDYLNNEFI